MTEMVNGKGTGHLAQLPMKDVKLAGKSGTAQVVGLNIGNGKGGSWKHRDHGHFVCFAPADNPRYACAVMLEHSGGSKAAMPVARDIMTYLFDKQVASDALKKLEAGWGGTPQERMASKYRQYEAEYGVSAPKVATDDDAVEQASSAAPPPQPIQSDAASPAPEPAAETPDPIAPADTPSPAPSDTGAPQ